MRILGHDLKGVHVTAINSSLQAYQTSSQYSWMSEHAYRNHLKVYGHSLYDEAVRFGEVAGHWAHSLPFDLIHAHDWMTYPAGMVASQKSGKPWVAHVHATEYDRTGGHVDSRIAELEYQGLSKADRIIAVSGYTKDIINRVYQIPPDKITVVHNGIDPIEYTPQDIRRVFPHDHIVLFVGRLTFQKGLEYFLQSARFVLEKHPDTVFLVVGDGDMFQRHIMEAAMLGVSSRVIFTGHMSGSKLKALYQMADVFVMPSVSEPYGLVALEAIASGTPCIVSKQSGVAETVNHVHTVDFWDTQKMAQLILNLLSYPNLAHEMMLQARQELNHLSWNEAAQKTLSVYQSLLA